MNTKFRQAFNAQRSKSSVTNGAAIIVVGAILLFLVWLVPALLVWSTSTLFATGVGLTSTSWFASLITLILLRGNVIVRK